MTVEETKHLVTHTIRQAIAFDDLDALNDIKSVSPSDITLDDLSTAATIQSFQVLGWMLKRSSLSNSDIIYLLKQQKSDPFILRCLADHLTTYAISKHALNNIIETNKLSDIDEILHSSS